MSDNYSLSSDSEFERRRTYGGGSSDSEGRDPSTEPMDGSGEEAEVAGAASGTTAGEDSRKTTLVLNPAMIDVYHKELVGQGLWERCARRDMRERYYLSDAQRTKMEPPSVKGCRISGASTTPPRERPAGGPGGAEELGRPAWRGGSMCTLRVPSGCC